MASNQREKERAGVMGEKEGPATVASPMRGTKSCYLVVKIRTQGKTAFLSKPNTSCPLSTVRVCMMETNSRGWRPLP